MSGWRPIEALPEAWEERPYRQFIRLEGSREHSGHRWPRSVTGEARTSQTGPFGYNADDIARLKRIGDLEHMHGVTLWMPYDLERLADALEQSDADLFRSTQTCIDLARENKQLKEGLVLIANHPHCNGYGEASDGHRCAAKIAREILKKP